MPLKLKRDAGPMVFLSTTTVSGTATDVTLPEVTIGTFFPVDEKTVLTMMRQSGC